MKDGVPARNSEIPSTVDKKPTGVKQKDKWTIKCFIYLSEIAQSHCNRQTFMG